ncbi:hypothetical protein QUC32_08855 [Novosphingobium resinovorum]|uniref:hypothetical protein n=1 Tax=Novosphingobium resinovorum TaxID=158500 RepID=UPI00259FEE39|nr:hypothetical protein [Novosphingobium resinovorum]WJM25243.1 hypothetical protein QUC32_08855 [Novosphingobium resinovorum]
MRFAIGGFSCALALLLLAGCGGDNSGGNGSTPAPTPVPTPVAPAPSPTPTSSAVYQVSIGGPAIGSLTFDTNGSGKFHDTVNNVSDLTISTNRKGQFGPGVADQPTGAMLPENPGRVPVKVGALSLDTGFFYMGIVPAMDSEIIASPVQAAAVIQQAIAHAYGERGVAHISIPPEVFAAKVPGPVPSIATLRPWPEVAPAAADITALAQMIGEAKTVAVLCGFGCHGAAEELKALSMR